MDVFTKGALWDYWKMGGDEIEVSDDESSDLEEYWSEKEETAKKFKIETDGLKPMKITKTIRSTSGTRMYHGYMTNHGSIMEYGRNRNQLNILANLSTIKLDVRNGQHVVGERMVINSLHYQDLEWYEALEDSELKDEALRNKAIIESLISDDESGNDCWKRWKSYEIYYHNYDEGECENTTHEDGRELCSIKTRKVLKKNMAILQSQVKRTLEAKNIDEYWWIIYKSGDLKVLES
ncbi:hypothetical protein Tco_1392273 [Tanacetum coccineum]